MSFSLKNQTVYSVLENDLRRDIHAGRISENSAISSEPELAARYGLSRNTVRKALANLVEEGLLKKIQGRGTFVVPAAERIVLRRSFEVKNRQIVFLNIFTAFSERTFRSVNTFDCFFNGINKILTPKGYNLLFNQIEANWVAPPCLFSHDVCGVIFHGRMEKSFWEQYISPLPSVGLQHINMDIPCSWVELDNFSRSYQAVEVLYKLGHRRIGYVSNEMDFSLQQERFEGFVKAMKLFNLPIKEEYLATWQRPMVNNTVMPENIDNIPDYWIHLEKAFKTSQAPTAFVCSDNWRAHCTQVALQKAGYRIPEDISLLGGFNIADSSFDTFSGFIDRLEDICSEGAKLLLEQLEAPSAVKNKTVLLRPDFIPGKTLAPPKQ